MDGSPPYLRMAFGLSWRVAMGQVVTIGLNIAKSVFQVHGIDEDGAVVIRQKLPRAPLLSFFAEWSPASSASRRAA